MEPLLDYNNNTTPNYSRSKYTVKITMVLFVMLFLVFSYTDGAQIKIRDVRWAKPLIYSLMTSTIFSSFIGVVLGVLSYKKKEDAGESKSKVVIFHVLVIVIMSLGLLLFYALVNTSF